MATQKEILAEINARLDELTAAVQVLTDKMSALAHEDEMVALDTRIQTITGQLKALVTPSP